MAIFIISRRPMHPHNERAWSYINRFSADNAEANGTPERQRSAAYAALKRRAESMAHAWRVAEPDSQFRVMDSGVHNPSDKFDPEFDKPKPEVDEPAADPLYVVEYKDGPKSRWKRAAFERPGTREVKARELADLDEHGGGVYRLALLPEGAAS